MADDWDLQAVVRGCTANNSASSCSSSSSNCSTTFSFISSTSATTCGGENSIMFPQQDENFPLNQDLYEINNCGSQDLYDLYKPFIPKPSSPLSPQSIIPISSLSVLGLQDLSHHHHRQQHHQQQQQMLKPKQNLSMVSPYKSKTSNASPQPQNSRSKRRKNQMKRVIEIPAEALSSDMWSWRKYGQKPIKGSPYPRGYYRCSTSKGCLARKQVERNRSDPGMFIVTYTAEHNHPIPTHRNSLAGSSRQKPSTSGDPIKPSGSPPMSSDNSVSPEYEKLEIENCKDEMIEDDEDENMSNSPSCMNLEDDFFDGLDEIVGIPPAPPISNTFSSQNTTQFPWFTNNATTTAAGGV